MRRTLQLGALLLVTASTAQAQRTLQSVGNDFKHAGGDIVSIWTSPFHASRRDWLGAAAAIGATLLVLPIDDDVDRSVVSNPDSPILNLVDIFREDRRGDLVDLGTGKLIQPVSGVAYIVGVLTDKRGIRDAALGCSSMQFSNSAIRKQVLDRLIARPRPTAADSLGYDQYRVEVPGGGHPFHSFPAGHFMNAVGCASYFSNRFHLSAFEPVMYAAALGIGIGRLADRRHWTSDSVLGAAMGYAIGRTIAGRQLERLKGSRAPGGGGASLGAAAEDGEMRYLVAYRMTF